MQFINLRNQRVSPESHWNEVLAERMISKHRCAEICQLYQQQFVLDDPPDLSKISLHELRLADARIGEVDLNSRWRLLMRAHIRDMQEAVDLTRQTRSRKVDYCVAAAIAIITGITVGLVLHILGF